MANVFSKLSQKLHSNTLQTVITVSFIVFMSSAVSLWLFWRSLYLPELKNHASYLASEIKLLDHLHTQRPSAQAPSASVSERETFGGDRFDNQALNDWFETHSHIQMISDPLLFPDVTDKPFVEYFTDVLAMQISQELGRQVQVYFKFKPTPVLWIQDSGRPNVWLAESLSHYSQYSTGILVMFIAGLPILTLLVILMFIRALNRPLKRLERTASDYIDLGSVTHLPTDSGPREIRKVNTAFNRLFTTLSQVQKERTIMLAGISHDLRTPLTRMRLTAEMLGDEFFKEGLIYDIEDMDAILEQFISFMKDGSDEAVRMTNLDSICHEIMVQFGDVAFVYDNRLHHDVAVRPLSIKRLLINLINNAIRYGKPPIHLNIHIVTQDDTVSTKDVLILSVSDEGDGVAEDQLERIMQPFERGESARTTQGSGLGLAIVERIAKLHQGAVTATSTYGQGLTIMVHIPLPKTLPDPNIPNSQPMVTTDH